MQHLGGGAAGNDRLELAPALDAAADVVDQLAHRERADLEFVVARLFNVAADAEQARAGVVRLADLGELRAAHAHDVLDVAERLDVVDDGRAHVEPEHGGKIGRLDARIGALALQRFDEAGFLAADVGARAPMDVNFQVVRRAADTFAQEALRLRLLDRLLQNLRAEDELAADIDVGKMHVVRVAGDDHALEQLVRVLIDDLPILERAGFGFVRVADEVDRLGVLLGIDEAPLHAAGKSRAAAPAQPGRSSPPATMAGPSMVSAFFKCS